MFCAQVAQLVEQGTENPCVGGSIPPLGTTHFNYLLSDTIRNMLIEFSKELGVTDPASGPVLIDQSGLVAEPGKTITGKIKV